MTTKSDIRYICKKCGTTYHHPWHHYCDLCQCEEFVPVDEDGQLLLDFAVEGCGVIRGGENG